MDVINLLYKIRRSDAIWSNILSKNQKMMLKYQSEHIVNSESSEIVLTQDEETIKCEPFDLEDLSFNEMIDRALTKGISLPFPE